MPKPRGRQPGFVMGPEHRLKIANSNVLNCLIQHAEGTREMSATQVSAGIALLRKVLPDLSVEEVNVSGSVQIERIEYVIIDPQHQPAIEHEETEH